MHRAPTSRPASHSGSPVLGSEPSGAQGGSSRGTAIRLWKALSHHTASGRSASSGALLAVSSLEQLPTSPGMLP